MSRRNIQPFIEAFHINTDEFETPVEKFPSFGAFFMRTLKLSARPIDPNPMQAAMPADGSCLVGTDGASGGFCVKGRNFDLAKFIDDPKLAKEFRGGKRLVVRLAPKHYHHIHAPCAGEVVRSYLVKGFLYSVHPWALYAKNRLEENKREVIVMQTKDFGRILYVVVGATNVGSIIMNKDKPGDQFAKGEDIGHFGFGGSTVVMMFQPGMITFAPDLVEASQAGIELESQMGSELGFAASPHL